MEDNHQNLAVRIAEAQRLHPEWRYGQAAFNCAPGWLQEEIRGTWRDPFHVQNRHDVDAWILWAEQQEDPNA
jgi:hypothetical protein